MSSPAAGLFENLARALRLQPARPMPIWRRLRRKRISSIPLFFFLLIKHIRACSPLIFARRGSALDGFLKPRPEILEMLYTPYLAANWDAKTRFARIIDHCETVKAIGGVFD